MNPIVTQEILEVIKTEHYRPAVSIIMPFEPKMSLKTELAQCLKTAADKVAIRVGIPLAILSDRGSDLNKGVALLRVRECRATIPTGSSEAAASENESPLYEHRSRDPLGSPRTPAAGPRACGPPDGSTTITIAERPDRREVRLAGRISQQHRAVGAHFSDGPSSDQ